MKWLLGIVVAGGLFVVGYVLYMVQIANPKVVNELRNNPTGERAQRVMLLTLPDGRSLPVNYLRDDDKVFAGADGRWWRAFRDGGVPVTVLIRGETLTGHAKAVLDDPEYTAMVFSRLRPTVPEWLPDWLDGVLVVVALDPEVGPLPDRAATE